MSSYEQKENYMIWTDNLDHWRHHPNYFIINDSKEYLKGNCMDIGCYIGILACWVNELTDATHIMGLDINEMAIYKAREMAIRHGFANRATFEVLNLVTDDTSAYNGQYDSMISFHTLEHIYPEDAKTFVAKQFDMLRPGGYCLIYIPYDHAYPDPCHVAFYKEDNLKELYESVGFVTLKCFKDDQWHENDLLHGLFQKPLV